MLSVVRDAHLHRHRERGRVRSDAHQRRHGNRHPRAPDRLRGTDDRTARAVAAAAVVEAAADTAAACSTTHTTPPASTTTTTTTAPPAVESAVTTPPATPTNVSDSDLAFTGSRAGDLISLSVILLALGLGVLAFRRRRGLR